MEFNQKYIDKKRNTANKIENYFISDSIEKLNYLYPNGHRITNQMKWFKGSRDRGLKSDIAA